MPADLDIVGSAAVDVVPIAPLFHTKLKGIVLPAADRVGEEAGRRIGDAMSRHIVVAIPDAITNGGRTARAAATRQGDDNAGSFARAFKSRLEVAFRSLPRPDVRLSTTGFDADLARVRARMEALSNKRVGVDIDAATAVAELNAIDAKLAELGSRSPDIQVRADIATARAEIAAMQRSVNELDRDDVRVTVHANTAQAQAALFQLAVSLGAVAALPVVPVAAAGIGALASAFVAAGAGVGAFALAAIPAIKGVTGVMQLQSAAADEAARATGNSAAANVKAAQSALQMTSAQAALRTAQRQSAQAVADAERSLSDAKRSARDAELDLTQARKDATQQLKDLNDELLDGMLDEREATLRVKEAKEALNKVISDPTSTDLERERARLSYDEAVRNADKQKAKNKELKQTVTDANKAGVEGSKAVKDATQRVADAQRKVQDRAKAVATAQVQGAEAVAAAERGIQSARLSSVNTTARAVTKTDEYRQALAKLSPEQRDLYDAIAGPKGLKSAFKDWAAALAPDVLPLFVRGVNGAKTALPGLSPLVRETADGISDLQDAAGKELRSPFWRGFKKDIEGSAKPAVVGLGKAFGNVFKGMAGVVDAFLPHMDSIADRLVKKTGRFADWGANLKGSPEFEKFLQYVAEHGPIVGKTFGDLAGAVLGVAKALEPFSTVILELVGYVAQAIGYVAEHAPWAIQLLYGLWIATRLWNLAMASNPIGLVVLALVGLALAVKYAWGHFEWFRNVVTTTWNVILLVGKYAVAILTTAVLVPILFAVRLVGLIVMWLWTDSFRPTFENIARVANWLWLKILQPVFRFIWDGVKVLGGGFVWLYDHAVKPAFGWIADRANWLNDKILNPVFGKMKSAVALVGDAFELARDTISAAWSTVGDIAKKPVNFIIEWVYTKGIKAVWDKVAGFVGLGKLPAAPKLLEAGGTVGSGWGPAVPMKVNRPTAIVGEGNPRYPEYVIPTDPKYRGRAKALHQAAGTQLLESGGVLGNVWDWTKDTVGDVVGTAVDWAKTGADLLTNPSKVWTKLVSPILNKVTAGVGSSPMGKAIGQFPVKMVGGLKDMLVNAASSLLGSGGGGNGQWAKPVSVGYGTRFGVAGSMWSSGHHTGLDFPAPVGTPVRAVDAGTVVGVGHGGPYGNNIELSHGGGLTSLYAHLSKILVGLNTKVGRGEHIGDVGATGNVTGPHLHLEARLNGRAVDPMPYLTGGGGGFTSKATGAAQQYAKSILSNYGWDAAQFGPLQKLWNGESGWRWDARNNSSGAYGIPQALPASKMAAAGPDWLTNYQTQIRWGLGYIKNRRDYGSPAAAYQKWLSRSPHWYDDGGYLPPGLSLVANGTGSPEPVFTGSQWNDIRASKSSGPTTVHADVRVFVGDREITDIVRTEINTYDAEVATDLNNGRRI
ncbi:peptidoglycan DD-metalloendopeptidase family protein [Streptomyces sp. NPDC051677]|uniref:aggregation-promoting factor C-terminal-like domain-containing protein n=1 Tax=Streptomyces sp. NPDC051677 TaxID=3365669 RepID=UPI0037D522E2